MPLNRNAARQDRNGHPLIRGSILGYTGGRLITGNPCGVDRYRFPFSAASPTVKGDAGSPAPLNKLTAGRFAHA